MSIQTISLPAGQVLTVTAVTAATLYRMTGAVPGTPTAIAAAASSVVGPFGESRVYAVNSELPATYSLAAHEPASTGDTLTGVVLEAPTINDPTIDGATVTEVVSLNLTNDVTISVCDGVPEDAVRATLSRNPAGDDNALTFTAVAYGAGGNSITIAYVDPGAADAALSVSVVGSAITVNLATDELEAITSTAADVLAAIEADAAADALVTVAIDATDSGVADDGSGVVTALAAAPMTGGEGTGIGTAGPGSLCVDYTNADLYVNGGTLAVPVWKLVTRAA